MQRTGKETRVDDPLKDAPTMLIDSLKTSSFADLAGHEKLWEKFLLLIGEKLCKKKIYDDGLAIRKLYKDSEFLLDLDILTFL